MKKNKLFIALSFILFLTGCVKEFTDGNLNKSATSSEVTIIGNSAQGYTDNETRAISVENISIGDSILFYSTGGVKSNGEILKYENGVWTGLKDNKWYVEEGPANIIAFYPIIKDVNDLYDENRELKDIVCCKDTFNTLKTINLTFNHIFAKFVINIDKGLNDTIKKVYIKIPQKINSIDLSTGIYTTENNSDLIYQEKNESGKYDFFIPCNKEMTLSFKIECDNTTLDEITVKENMLFKSGFEYICNVRKNSENGIYTKEDFIAFTHLINGATEYNGKRIEDLYTEINGKRVFNLYNDLSFTEEEAKLIRRIGDNNGIFDDIFDGNNHTLENISLNCNNISSNMGLFDKTSDNSIIRNLTIRNCKYPNINHDITALLIGLNNGMIDNCHITNGVIPNGEPDLRVAGVVAQNNGRIINCSISGLEFNSKAKQIAKFANINEGYIMNCRIKNNFKINTTNIDATVICRKNNGNIFNIFIEQYQDFFWGICKINDIRGQYNNCILPKGYSNKLVNTDDAKDTYLKGKYLYSDTQGEYNNIADSLNKWINEIGNVKYPQFNFRKWKTDPSEKVIFE